MKLPGESPSTKEHLITKRELSDHLDHKSCNNNNNNNSSSKRIKHHRERDSSSLPKMSIPTISLSSEDEESYDNSSPFNICKPAIKATKTSNSKLHEDEKQRDKPASSLDTVNKNRRKTLTIQENDDSSSTSNCSCEQHSNEQTDDEDFREKLDYDEDSITNSPICSTSSNNNNTSALVSSSERSSSITAIINEEKDSCSYANEHTNLETLQQKQTASLKPKASLSAHSHLRLKSVINLNHRSKAPNKIEKSSRVSEESSPSRSYRSMLKYLFKDACFFQMKSINHENIKISKSMGIWSTPIPNELRLNLAFREHRNVILIFSVQQSGGFQGFARMISESKPATRTLPWILPERLNSRALRGVFEVQWICKKELPFHLAHDLYNPYNDNKPVKVARDGQQVESKTGKKLCKLFPEDNRDKLLDVVSLMKHQTSQRKKYPHRYDNDSHPFAYRQNLDSCQRDAHPSHNFNFNNDEHHARPDEQLNFNYRRFDPQSSQGFYDNLVRPPPSQYHQHYHHHPLHNQLPCELPMVQYTHQDFWNQKHIMLPNKNGDYRQRR